MGRERADHAGEAAWRAGRAHQHLRVAGQGEGGPVDGDRLAPPHPLDELEMLGDLGAGGVQDVPDWHEVQVLADHLGAELRAQFRHQCRAQAPGAPVLLLPLGDAPGQNGVGLDEQFPQEGALPVGPHLGAHGIDVQVGEEVEHSEQLLVPDQAGELDDQALVVQVSPLGDVGHAEMLGDEEGDGGDVAGRQAPCA